MQRISNRSTDRMTAGLAYTKIPLNESYVLLEEGEDAEQCFTGFVADRLAEYEDADE